MIFQVKTKYKAIWQNSLNLLFFRKKSSIHGDGGRWDDNLHDGPVGNKSDANKTCKLKEENIS